MNIYALLDENNKIRYIGKTNEFLYKRLMRHLKESRDGEKTHKCNWIRSMLKKGIIPKIIFIGLAEGNGAKEEIAWIKYFKDEGIDLTNSTDGGEGMLNPSVDTRKKLSIAHRGKPLSEEHRRKISLAQKGEKESPEAIEKNRLSHIGQMPTPEAIAKRIKSRAGYCHSLETRQKIGQANKISHLGKKLSPEHKRNISIGNKGRIFSLETRQKLSIARQGKKPPMLGKHHSLETIKKMRLIAKGRIISPETRHKLSCAVKEFYAKKKGI